MTSLPKYVFSVLFLLIVITGLVLCTSFQKKDQIKKPNIILIIADDLGYGDLASYGNKFVRTPNIDALGKTGIRFTEAYTSAPICGPLPMHLLKQVLTTSLPKKDFLQRT